MKKKKLIKGLLAPSPSEFFLSLMTIKNYAFRGWHALIIIVCLSFVFVVFPYKTVLPLQQEEVSLIEVHEEPPPPPPPSTEPPEPKKISTDPEQIPQQPPDPQFGLPDESTDESSDMVVATGNTLMTSADTIVKTTPSPIAPVVDFQKIKNSYLTDLAMLLQERKLYPRIARRLGQEGIVKVCFSIEKDGLITNVTVSGESPYEILNESAKQTVEQLGIYKPIPQCLQLPKLVVTIPINYDLN
jgi:periplasmic protein TonB